MSSMEDDDPSSAVEESVSSTVADGPSILDIFLDCDENEDANSFIHDDGDGDDDSDIPGSKSLGMASHWQLIKLSLEQELQNTKLLNLRGDLSVSHVTPAMWDNIRLVREEKHRLACAICRIINSECLYRGIQMMATNNRMQRIRSFISERMAGMKRLASVPLGTLPKGELEVSKGFAEEMVKLSEMDAVQAFIDSAPDGLNEPRAWIANYQSIERSSSKASYTTLAKALENQNEINQATMEKFRSKLSSRRLSDVLVATDTITKHVDEELYVANDLVTRDNIITIYSQVEEHIATLESATPSIEHTTKNSVPIALQAITLCLFLMRRLNDMSLDVSTNRLSHATILNDLQFRQRDYVLMLTLKEKAAESDEESIVGPHGWMWKKGSFVANWKRRYFALWKGMLMYYFVREQDYRSFFRVADSGLAINAQGFIPLNDATRVTVGKSERNSSMKALFIKTKSRTWVLEPELQDTVFAWQEIFEKCVTERNRRRSSMMLELSEKFHDAIFKAPVARDTAEGERDRIGTGISSAAPLSTSYKGDDSASEESASTGSGASSYDDATSGYHAGSSQSSPALTPSFGSPLSPSTGGFSLVGRKKSSLKHPGGPLRLDKYMTIGDSSIKGRLRRPSEAFMRKVSSPDGSGGGPSTPKFSELDVPDKFLAHNRISPRGVIDERSKSAANVFSVKGSHPASGSGGSGGSGGFPSRKGKSELIGLKVGEGKGRKSSSFGKMMKMGIESLKEKFAVSPPPVGRTVKSDGSVIPEVREEHDATGAYESVKSGISPSSSISSCLNNGITSIFPYFTGKEPILQAGYMFKKGDHFLKKWRKRYFVLCGGVLYYEDSESMMRNAYEMTETPPSKIDLRDVTDFRICPPGVGSSCPNVSPRNDHTVLELDVPGRTYALAPESEADALLWEDNLKMALGTFENALNVTVTSSSSSLRGSKSGKPYRGGMSLVDGHLMHLKGLTSDLYGYVELSLDTATFSKTYLAFDGYQLKYFVKSGDEMPLGAMMLTDRSIVTLCLEKSTECIRVSTKGFATICFYVEDVEKQSTWFDTIDTAIKMQSRVKKHSAASRSTSAVERSRRPRSKNADGGPTVLESVSIETPLPALPEQITLSGWALICNHSAVRTELVWHKFYFCLWGNIALYYFASVQNFLTFISGDLAGSPVAGALLEGRIDMIGVVVSPDETASRPNGLSGFEVKTTRARYSICPALAADYSSWWEVFSSLGGAGKRTLRYISPSTRNASASALDAGLASSLTSDGKALAGFGSPLGGDRSTSAASSVAAADMSFSADSLLLTLLKSPLNTVPDDIKEESDDSDYD